MTGFPGQSLAPPGALATPFGDEDAPEVPGGATFGGVTPMPTIGQ